MLRMSPLDWFGKWQESGSAEAPATADYPSKLGKVGRLVLLSPICIAAEWLHPAHKRVCMLVSKWLVCPCFCNQSGEHPPRCTRYIFMTSR